jgi:hypothetical protein
MNLYGSALAYGIDTFVGLALQIDRRLVAAEQRGHIRSHLGLAGTDLGPLADDRDVDVADTKALSSDAGNSISEKHAAVLPIMGRVRIWKELANIGLTNRSKESVCHCMEHGIAIGMAYRPKCMIK